MLKPLHPVLKLLAAQPQLALDHVGVYVDWLGSEMSRVSVRWRMRLILSAVAIASVGVAVVLAGVALMLAAALPSVSPSATWVGRLNAASTLRTARLRSRPEAFGARMPGESTYSTGT